MHFLLAAGLHQPSGTQQLRLSTATTDNDNAQAPALFSSRHAPVDLVGQVRLPGEEGVAKLGGRLKGYNNLCVGLRERPSARAWTV